MKRFLLLVAVSIILTAGAAMASYAEPAYTVIEERDGYEIRSYAAHIVAEVTTRGTYKSSSSAAFRLLAGYIFGGNVAVGGNKSERMNMTVPVTGTPQDDGESEYVWTFYMEPSYTLDTLPKPDNPKVRLVQVEERVVAVKGYSGRNTQENFHATRSELGEALRSAGLEPVGVATAAVYNGPWTLPMFRRNEVLQEVTWDR